MMERESFRALVRAELEALPHDARPLTSVQLVERLCSGGLEEVECFKRLDAWCRDMSTTEPELKLKGPNRGKVVNARRWAHPSHLPAREPNSIEELRAKLRDLEARIVTLEQHRVEGRYIR